MSERAGYVVLDGRSVLAVAGEDRVGFLQGLVSNDMGEVGATRAAYTLFLTPQGKYLHDFLVAEGEDALLLDIQADRLADLARRLKMYKLRSKVESRDESARWRIVAAWGPGVAERLGLTGEAGAATAFAGGLAFVDPRTAALGLRLILPVEAVVEGTVPALAQIGLEAAGAADYERLRLRLGVPDGVRDMEVEKALPLENNLDTLNAISWSKGCYMGQELTARMRYRKLVRKRLFPVQLEGPLPAPGTLVLLGEREAGQMASGAGENALAMLRLEEVERATAENATFTAGSTRLTLAG